MRCHNITLTESHLPREGVRCRNSFLEAYLPRERKAFLDQRVYSLLIALGNKDHLCQLGERVSDASLVFHLPEDRQALLEQGTRPDVLTLTVGQQCQREERVSDVLLVVRLITEY